jgi:hypothetical protein
MLYGYTMMHGQQHIQTVNAQQAKFDTKTSKGNCVRQTQQSGTTSMTIVIAVYT